jgi:hypothetical protein
VKRIIVNIVRLYKDRPRRRIRRRVLLFSSCLIAALLIWLLNTLGKTYKFTVAVPVVFENIPPGKTVVIKDRREIKLMIEGTGWHFLRSKISMFDEPIKVDLRNDSEKRVVNLDKQLLKLNEQIPVKVKIINIDPAQLSFEFEKKANKKIPVKLMSNITFDHNYYFDGKITLMPDSIVITGPSEIVNRISEWQTEVANFSDLNYTVVRDVKLIDNDHLNITLSAKKIMVAIPVEKYTEGEKVVPVRLKGLLSLSPIRMFPSVCTVRYQVSLSKYHMVKAQDFDVTASVNSFNSGKLNLSIIGSPDYILHPKLSPDQVDYIIRK